MKCFCVWGGLVERVVEGDAGALAVYAVQQSAAWRREIGDGEADAVAGEVREVGFEGEGGYLPMSTRA
jgi:hypothetical protein